MNERLNEIYAEEKSISIIDMLFYVLRRWKSVLAVALAAAIAVGTLTYMKSGAEVSEQPTTPEALLEQIDLSDSEKEELEYKLSLIHGYEKTIAESDEYLNHSIKANLDPNGFYEGKLQYVFSGADSTDVLEAALQCKGRLEAGDTLETMVKSMKEETTEAFLREAIEVSAGTNPEQTVIMEGYEKVLNVKVVHYDRAECENILSYLKEVMEAEAVVQSGKQVAVTKVADTVTLSVSEALIGSKREMINIKSAAYDALKNVKDGMSDIQKTYYELETQEKTIDTESQPKPEAETGRSVNMKYIVLAAVALAFCMAAFYAAAYLFGGHIHTRRELESCMFVPVAGYSTESGKKKNLIDRLIDSMEKKAGAVSGDTLEMLCAMLKNYAEQENVKKLYLSGSRVQGEGAEVFTHLKKMLAAEGIELVVGQNILTDAAAFQNAVDCGNVVFWETCHKSREKDIRAEVMKVLSCGAKVLAIVAEK